MPEHVVFILHHRIIAGIYHFMGIAFNIQLHIRRVKRFCQFSTIPHRLVPAIVRDAVKGSAQTVQIYNGRCIGMNFTLAKSSCVVGVYPPQAFQNRIILVKTTLLPGIEFDFGKGTIGHFRPDVSTHGIVVQNRGNALISNGFGFGFVMLRWGEVGFVLFNWFAFIVQHGAPVTNPAQRCTARFRFGLHFFQRDIA